MAGTNVSRHVHAYMLKVIDIENLWLCGLSVICANCSIFRVPLSTLSSTVLSFVYASDFRQYCESEIRV